MSRASESTMRTLTFIAGALFVLATCAPWGVDAFFGESAVCFGIGKGEGDKVEPELIFISKKPSLTIQPFASKELSKGANPVMKELRFKPSEIKLEELEKEGFNRSAPVSFLIHGFTSGYPYQTWMTSMVEAYTIDEAKNSIDGDELVSHNMFIVNWNYGARGKLKYARAISNMKPVSKFVAEFLNKVLLEEANVKARRVQIIGHSLGAHLAGFIARQANQKIGRIIGLDPAGPCFRKGAQRLDVNDAEQVATIHTNTDMLGNQDPLGMTAVFVEGGKIQPSCDLSTISSWSLFGLSLEDFAKYSCSHSRAADILTYQLSTSIKDDCQLVGYECDSWENFKKGHCGVCGGKQLDNSAMLMSFNAPEIRGPLSSVSCARFGLEWQYNRGYGQPSRRQAFDVETIVSSGSNKIDEELLSGKTLSKANRNTSDNKKMFMRSVNMQPFCAYHYQIVLQLNDKFSNKNQPLEVLIQDATFNSTAYGGQSRNSLTIPEMFKYDPLTYTALATSSKKMFRAKHATLIVPDGLPKADWGKLERLTVNYMSNVRADVRKRLSADLCLTKTGVDQQDIDKNEGGRRFYFKPCESGSIDFDTDIANETVEAY